MKSNLLKVLLPAVVILGLVIAGLQFIKKSGVNESIQSDAHKEAGVGSVLPDFLIHKFNGGEENISKLKGKVFIVNFWATWCEACMSEMPSLVKLQAQYKDQGLTFVPISVDENPAQVVPRAISQFKMDFPIYLDTDNKLTEAFDVHGIPFTVIFDQNRKVLLTQVGEKDWLSPEFQERLKDWLK